MHLRLIPFALFVLAAPLAATAAPPPPLAATAPLQQQVEQLLAAAPQGTRFGLVVVDEAGRELVAVNPDQRFIPASNTKLFTTAAAYALLEGIDQPDAAGGTQVRLEPAGRGGVSDVVLVGRGDARMSSAADCTANCLATLADAVAAKTRRVRHVVGDARLWPDQRWVPGMSWNNIGTDSGTAVAALNLDDNELPLVVTASAPGQPAVVTLPGYFTVRNEARTVAPGGQPALVVERGVHGREVRVSGTIPAGAAPWRERLGIDDPAHYAAWRLAELLTARGVRVTGEIQARYRPADAADRPQPGTAPAPAMPAAAAPALASLVPPPLAEDIGIINRISQNLHAQALFRRLGAPTGSEEWAARRVRALFERAGLPPQGFELADGSGMSTYNRVSPRAMIALLRWVDRQPWGAAWSASLPVPGGEGTLRRRFLGTPLAGNLAAKTGTLNATNALSGTLRSAAGQRLHFAFLANDVPAGTSVLPVMEAVLVRIAAAR